MRVRRNDRCVEVGNFLVGQRSAEEHQIVHGALEFGHGAICLCRAKLSMGAARVGDIGNAIQKYVEEVGYSVVRDLVGHGLGKNLHEKPEVPNYGRRGTGPKLKEGMVLAIEPMINLGTKRVVQEKDGWTIRTADRMPSVHFEHDVAINDQTPDLLSSFVEIESAIKKNINLVYI